MEFKVDTKKNQFLILTLLLTLGAISFTYSAITQKSQPVVPGSRITSNAMNNIAEDISALNLAIDGITAGSDVKIGTLTNGKWCTSDGSKVNCNVDAPSGTVNEATVDGYVINNGYLTTESDPKIGAITESKYCVGVGGKVVCNSDVSAGGSSAWGDLTGVPAGFSDGIDNETAYTHPITAGNKHIPAGGAANQVLKYSADGTAVWGTDADTIYTHPATTGNKHVPSGGATDNVLKYSADGTAVWGAETDPKIDTITEGKYCVGIGGKVTCATNSPISKFIDGTMATDAVFSGGNVGIGTATPTAKLTIDTGNISLTDEYGLGWGGATPTNGIKGNATTNYVAIKTNNTEKVRVDSVGNFGIGTITPSEKLHVTGNAKLSGFVQVGQLATASLPVCDGTKLGAIVYNITEDDLYVCTARSGGTWKPLGEDDIPSAFSFTDKTLVSLNSVIESNILQITGFSVDTKE